MAAELAPHAWRDMTESMVARRVLAAVDRYGVLRLLHTVPGTAPGAWHPLEPAAAGDPRGEVLTSSLRGRCWWGFSVERLCVDLLAALDAWQAARDSSDS